MTDICVVIPAFKKNEIISNDLLKKIKGKPLLGYQIDVAKRLGRDTNIVVMTDSAEVSLFVERAGVASIMSSKGFFEELQRIETSVHAYVLLSPYAPLIPLTEIERAVQCYEARKSAGTVIVSSQYQNDDFLYGAFLGKLVKKNKEEKESNQGISGDIVVFGADFFKKNTDHDIIMHELGGYYPTIRSIHDFWIFEKLLERKRIVFNVIGTKESGFGHIYRAKALAHTLQDHEIVFVCGNKSQEGCERLIGNDYLLRVISQDRAAENIAKIKPDLVINDVLNTDAAYMSSLLEKSIRTVNFEDLGDGSAYADLVINELYDEPHNSNDNVLWGHDYFFLRDEFEGATPNLFSNHITAILVTFGGTDQNDYTRKILRVISEQCRKYKIKVYIVTGAGYSYISDLEFDIKKYRRDLEIEYVHHAGVMSNIMEQCQIAITSNGRTVYELAYMNIPSIIISHHDRENTHLFSRKDHGFFPLGTYDGKKTDCEIQAHLSRLIQDVGFRKKAYDRISGFDFVGNKAKVRSILLDVMNAEQRS